MMTGLRHVPHGAGETWWVVGDTYTFKATAEDTTGSLALVEAYVPVDGGPPPHVHVREDEFFYLLDGELEINDGTSSFVATAGSFLFVPRGTEHACTEGAFAVTFWWLTGATALALAASVRLSRTQRAGRE